VSVASIADRLGRHRSSIKRLLVKARDLFARSIPDRKKGSVRPFVINSHAMKVLERFVRKNPTATAGNINEQVPEVAAVSVKHISRLITKKLKIPSRIAAQKLLLTLRRKKKRLTFTKQYRHFTADDWSTVMYSDESTFRCIRLIRSMVRRPSDMDRFDSGYTVKTVKHLTSLMVWVCFSGTYGHGEIFFLPPHVTMNGELYQDVLENHLLLFMAMHRSIHFLQDCAPCHASKIIKDFLSTQPFQVIDWPGNSPYLNLIENAWNYIKRSFKSQDIFSVPKLKEAILKMWTQDMSQKYLRALIDSMLKRIEAVINARGDMTKY
jgi:hypothetical protein